MQLRCLPIFLRFLNWFCDQIKDNYGYKCTYKFYNVYRSKENGLQARFQARHASLKNTKKNVQFVERKRFYSNYLYQVLIRDENPKKNRNRLIGDIFWNPFSLE